MPSDRRRACALLLCLSVVSLSGACGGGDGGTQPTAAVATVAVSITSPTIAVPNTAQASATPRDASGNALSGRTITWSSSGNAVATVSSSGLVTAVGPGNATITATSEGKSGDVAVTVTPPAVSAVTVALAAASITAGSTTQATATTRDAQANVLTGRVVAWTSSNQGVATVSSGGVVTGVAPGTADITATSEGVSAKATLTVTSNPGQIAGFTLTANGAPLDTANVAGEFTAAVTVDVPAGFNGVLVLTVDGKEFARENVTAALRQSVFAGDQYTLQAIAGTTALRAPQQVMVRCNTSIVHYSLDASDNLAASVQLPNSTHLARLALSAVGQSSPLATTDFQFSTFNPSYVTGRFQVNGNSVTAGGTLWRSGDVTVNLLPVSYDANAPSLNAASLTLADWKSAYNPNAITGLVNVVNRTGGGTIQPFSIPKADLVYESPSVGSNLILQSYQFGTTTVTPSVAEPRLAGNCVDTRQTGLVQPLNLTLSPLPSGCSRWVRPTPLPQSVLTNNWLDIASVLYLDDKPPAAASAAFTLPSRPQTIGAAATVATNQFGSLDNYFTAGWSPGYGIDLSRISDLGAGLDVTDRLTIPVHYGLTPDFVPSAMNVYMPQAMTPFLPGGTAYFKARVADLLGNFTDIPLTTTSDNPFTLGLVPSVRLGIDPAILRYNASGGSANYTGISDKYIFNSSALGSLSWAFSGSGSLAGYPTNAVSGTIIHNGDVSKPVWGEGTAPNIPWVLGGTGGASFSASLSLGSVAQRVQQLIGGTGEGYYSAHFSVNDKSAALPVSGTLDPFKTYISLWDYTRPATPIITGLGSFTPGQPATVNVRVTDNVDLESLHLGAVFDFNSTAFFLGKAYAPLSERPIGDGFGGARLTDHTESVAAVVPRGFVFFNANTGAIDATGYPTIGIMAQSEDVARNVSDVAALFFPNSAPVTKPVDISSMTFSANSSIGCRGLNCTGVPTSLVLLTLQYLAFTATDPLLKADAFALLPNKQVVRLGATGPSTMVPLSSQYRYTRTLLMDWATYCGASGALQIFVLAYTADRLFNYKNNPFLPYTLVEPPTSGTYCTIPKRF